MDQNPTNATGSDKRNWRERLGIAGKDMPKISGEFTVNEPSPPPQPADKPAMRTPHPVTKPAPMAPRVSPAKSQANPPAEPPPPPQPAAKPSDPLAEKLRAQRAAAEKLAEQRVLAARERAEAKLVPEPSPPRSSSTTPPTLSSRLAPPTGRPKFTFAEEEFTTPKKEPLAQPSGTTLVPPASRQGVTATAPLSPPRQALGGERNQPLLRPPTGQPQFRADPPPSYRPLDAASGYSAPRGRPFAPEGGGPGYGNTVPPRRSAYDPYRRGPDTAAGYEPSIHGDEAREPRPARPAGARGRQPSPRPDEEFGEIFEDEHPQPRRRASASDYNSAYREVEDGYLEDRRRSNGPWLLLLALLVAAVTAGGGIWAYQTKFKTTAMTASPENVPVVEAPQDPAKTAVEERADRSTETASRKLIYDRIVGDREVNGEQVAPAEAVPMPPEDQPTAGGATADESAPLALPPPPGDQGSLEQTGEDSMAAKPANVESVIAKPVAPATDTAAAMLPATGEAEPIQPPSLEQLSAKAAETPLKPTQMELPKMEDEIADEAGDPVAEAPPPDDQMDQLAAVEEPVKKKPAAAAKKTKPAAPEDTAALGAEPVVLVPPSQSADVIAPPSQGVTAPAQVAGQQPALPPAQPVVKKKKRTLMDLINNRNQPAPPAPATAPAAPATVAGTDGQVAVPTPPQGEQVASLPDPQQPPGTAEATTGSGYVVQLASFRSEPEAQAEYDRLRLKHGRIIGVLPAKVSQATVAGSTRYRLGLGPLASRDEASRVCSSLVAAGERDCLVRRQ